MKDFHEIAEARGFTEKYYPYAEAGLNSMKVILKSLKWSIISAIGLATVYSLRLLAGLQTPDYSQVDISKESWFSLSKQEIHVDAIMYDLKLQNITFFLKNFASSIVDLIALVFKTISISLLIVALLAIPVWIVLAILRMRNFEREVFRNDVEAALMKMGMIRRLSLRPRIRDLNRRISKSLESDSSGGQSRTMEIERLALQAIKNMKVFINTRQSMNGEEIERQYRIELTPEYEAAAHEKMMSELKNLDKVAEKELKGKVSFGSLTESTDRSMLTLKAVAVFEDKYDFSNWTADDDDDNAIYEGTFKLSHLKDNRAIIRSISHKAQLWAERSGRAVDEVLTTSNAKVDRLSTFVSASSALFTYKISFRIDLENFEKYQNSLDAAFGTSGTTVQIKNGDLLISIPLPKSLIVPIDVGTMYREVFGNDEIAANA